MQKIDFFISNNRHHVDMLQPLIQRLQSSGRYQCRVLSLCEWRGLPSPAERFKGSEIDFVQLLPVSPRTSPSPGKNKPSALTLLVKNLGKHLLWYSVLKRRLATIWATVPDLVVTPNDGAFPFNKISGLLRRRHIPFVLVQEGVKFQATLYGRGGASAIAAWGENSAAFFKRQGVPAKNIFLTGNARFAGINPAQYAEEGKALAATYHLGRETLLLLSNPIDDLGLCTTAEKRALIQRFVQQLAPLFENPDFHLVIKLHTRESKEAFQALVQDFPYNDQITVLDQAPLYPLFTVVKAAIVLASTTGLEALLLNVPLGVLEIPNVGFAFDYVQSGAAIGLTWAGDMREQVERLMSDNEHLPRHAEEYLRRNLVTPDKATDNIVRVIESLMEDGQRA